MFLIVKNSTNALCLEAAEATLATVYASIKEEYNNLELELVFNKPEIKVFHNIVSFIRELDKITSVINNETVEEDLDIESVITETEVATEIEEEPTQIEEIELETEELILSDSEIEEPIDFTEEEDGLIIEEPVIEIEEEVKEEVVVERVVPKVPNTPGDRMMETLKEQQKNEGLLELEGDKVNTLAYKEHLVNYMKLGFASSLLKKKIKECKDTAEQSRLYNFCDKMEKRTDEYENKFKEIGLTSGQVGTFRMEVLRDIRKYQDDSIRDLCEYINKLYVLSDNLIQNLK